MVFPLEQRPAMKRSADAGGGKLYCPLPYLKRKLFLLAVSSTPGRTTSAFCWEKLPLDTPHDWSQGILGSAAIACTSGVLHGLPKRIGFWRVPPYRVYERAVSGSGCPLIEPFFENILCRIDVAVVERPAFRALSEPNTEVFDLLVAVTTVTARSDWTGRTCQ